VDNPWLVFRLAYLSESNARILTDSLLTSPGTRAYDTCARRPIYGKAGGVYTILHARLPLDSISHALQRSAMRIDSEYFDTQ
jgi:hypothetical protein